MMKKYWLRWAIVVPVLIILIFITLGPRLLVGKPDVHAGAAVLMDMQTGELLMDVNGDTPMPSANMSKLMTELLVLEDIRAGRLGWNDEVKISRYASTVGGVNLSLRYGERLTVSELFQSMVVYSANDAAVALAERSAGSEPAFVKRMNDKAAKIGLTSYSQFSNASGAGQSELGPNHPENIRGETQMTASDTAKLASYLITSHPEILRTSSRTQMELKDKGIYISNTNWMLPALAGPYSYAGTDGLKAGYTSDAGYCFTGTAEQHGRRLVAVVLGAPSKEERFEQTRKLFDYGFALSTSFPVRVQNLVKLAPR
ncbi:UNVERIFIED_CONTAM: D-alanyl-D-alanine carboxypeptidase (penicillin-binding protein 5/6) [Paenibacillus sp. PvR008]